MVSLMQRRREMMQSAAAPVPSGPLYSFDDLHVALTSNYQQGWTSDGNHFKFTGTRRNYGTYWQFDKAGSTTDSAEWTDVMFTIPSGASVTMMLKNITTTSNRAGYFNFIMNRYEEVDGHYRVVGFRNADGNAITYASGDDTPADATATVTTDTASSIWNFYFYVYNPSSGGQNFTFEFDLELYVNGTRYI